MGIGHSSITFKSESTNKSEPGDKEKKSVKKLRLHVFKSFYKHYNPCLMKSIRAFSGGNQPNIRLTTCALLYALVVFKVVYLFFSF